MNPQLENSHFLFVVNGLRAFGGAERQALILGDYIFKYISKKVSFLAFEDGEDFKCKIKEIDIPIFVVPFDHKAGIVKKTWQYFQVIRKMRELKPDVIIPYVAEANKIVALTWKFTGAKFAFWNQREEGRKLYGTKLEKMAIQNVSAIVSNSFEGRDALVSKLGLDPQKITVINNGIIPYDKADPKTDWHKKLQIEKDRPIISMIANITKRKNHKTLLNAWQLVISSCRMSGIPLPFLVMAGRKDNIINELKLLAFDLKLCDHIAFTGEIDPVQPLIAESLFCVFSSNLEGCPNGVLECMEQKKAVIGTDISGIRQALGTKYEKHCLSKPNDPSGLAEKILALLKSPLLIKELEEYNFQRIKDDFSVEKMVKSHLKLIEGKLFQNR